MKRPTMLYQAMLRQLNIDLEVSVERDFEYIQSRLKHEGLSFLTLTLPVLSDALELGLEMGRFALPIGFKPIRRGGTLPAFLQGLFKRVFNLDGSLSLDPCPQSIYWIRQISRFYKKPKIPCSPKHNAAAVRRFKQIEEDLNDRTDSISRQDNLLDEVARILWTSVFPTVDHSSFICGHGPGVTADRYRSNERYRIRQWYERFEDSFPCADHAFHNYGQAWSGGSSEGVSGIKFLGITEEPPVRVVFVPKTLSTPRVIAIEPSCMQFVQQGLSRWMVDILESHKLTMHSVRFSDQTVNRELAYSASIDRSLATIDLSDASDRVHLDLVRRIFGSTHLLDYLMDARSLHADLPDGSNIVLRKYASMGSALCFPVEACVFYTLVLTAIMKHRGIRPSYKTISELSSKIAIYGDDIIIPVDCTDVVSDYLESYALRVNRRKSFSRSAFRESCGADYFNGVSVLPVYARQVAPERSSEWTPQHLMSWVSTADQFYLKGHWHLAQSIREMVESVVGQKLPRSRLYRPGLGFLSLIFDTKLRYNRNLQSYDQRRITFTPSKRKDKIDGDATACFNRSFSKLPRGVKQGYRNDPNSVRISLYPDVSQPGDLVQFLCNKSRIDEAGGTNLCFIESIHVDETAGELGGCTQRSRGLQRRVSFNKSILLRDPPEKTDFHNTTKRGVFTLKRQWTTIIS